MRPIHTAAAMGLVAALAAGQAQAVTAFTLTFGENSNSTNTPASGASGTALMTFSDDAAGVALLEILITNTTGTIAGPGGATATTSKLTGFGFDFVANSSFEGTFTAGTYFKEVLEPADMNPFSFGIGVADNTNFLGGNANDALPEGFDDTVSLKLSYSGYADADALGLAFFNLLSDDPEASGMRFMQVDGVEDEEGSDKLTNPDVNIIPVPFGAVLIGSAFLVAGAVSARARRKAA